MDKLMSLENSFTPIWIVISLNISKYVTWTWCRNTYNFLILHHLYLLKISCNLMYIYFLIQIYDDVEIAWWICLVKIKIFFSILWRIFQVNWELLRPLTANWKLNLLTVLEFAMSFREKKNLKVRFSIN